MSANGSSRSASPRARDRCSVICIVGVTSNPLGVSVVLTMKTALRRIELGVADVAEVDVTKQRVGLAHALQGRHRADPQHHRQTDPPPRRQAERQAAGDHDHHEHQFAIATEQEIRPIGGLMNH